MSDLDRLSKIKLYSIIILSLFAGILVGGIFTAFIFLPLGIILLIGSMITILIFAILNLIKVIALSDSSNKTIMVVFSIFALVGFSLLSSIVCLVISKQMIAKLNLQIMKEKNNKVKSMNMDIEIDKNNSIKNNEFNDK